MVDEMIEEYTKMTEEHAKKMEALDEVGRQMEAKQKERAETAEAEVEYLRKQLAELQKSDK